MSKSYLGVLGETAGDFPWVQGEFLAPIFCTPGGAIIQRLCQHFSSAVDPRACGRRRASMTYYGRRPEIINKYFYGRG